jgi:hypothetical protein
MKTILLFFTCLFLFAQTNAQKKMATNISEVESKQIKMPRFPIADLPKKCMPIADISIMQNVSDSVRLGFVLKGPDNQVAALITKKPLTSFLQDHIYKMYEDDFKKEGAKMFWVIKALRIGEKTEIRNEYSYLKFNADAYISTDGNSYALIASIDTVFASSSRVDVTAWHGTEIEDAFKLLLKLSVLHANDASFVKGNAYTMSQIIESEKIKTIPLILSTTIYEDGAYANYNEFLNNKPSITNYKLLVYDKNKIACVGGNNTDTLKIWGVCKQGEMYKYEEASLIPIEKFSNGFIISDFVQKVNRKNANAFAAAVIGGVAGSLIQGLLSSSRLFLVKTIPFVTKASKQPNATCIDMQSGELSF